MKRSIAVGMLMVALGACAPGRSAPAAGPAPASAAPAPTHPPQEAQPTAKLGVRVASAPGDWWEEDAASDGVLGTGAARAYGELLAGRKPAREVVVAIIDSGVDTAHADLRGELWTNPREVAGNGKDDDGNGYVDDVHGWNFLGAPDGRNVRYDTSELTRLYAAGRVRFAGVKPDTLSESARADYARWQEIERTYDQREKESQELLQRVRMVDQAMDQVTEMLRGSLGVDTLTEADVRGMHVLRPDLVQARQMYLQLADMGATPEVIKRDLAELESQQEYGLNPDYDPRRLVGDDIADLTQRRYGNADVTGPSAMHGTHVAGIIGAARGNGIGIDGLAPARLMVVRAVPDGDERDKDVANAIRYAVDNGAQIINMSFGKRYSPQKQAVDEAVRYADAHGVLMIHAAGNDGEDLATNENYPSRVYLGGGQAGDWIEVGASTWKGADSIPATFSNYGHAQVDLFAPGLDLRSTVPGNGYESLSGTSMAAPVVTGVAAMLMAYFPDLSAAQVRQILLETATPLGERMVVRPGKDGGRVRFGELSATGGVVNAYAAVERAMELSAAR